MTPVIRRLSALTLFAVLTLGALGHFMHDLEHAACDPVGARDPHPCTACLVMHVGAPVTQAVAITAPALGRVLHVTRQSLAAPLPAQRVAAIPRAPPIA